ncbi:MAG TPA: hypothetical protein VGL46_14715 [Pseudonocardiaceae bacterium]|jgi:hypothetical protein
MLTPLIADALDPMLAAGYLRIVHGAVAGVVLTWLAAPSMDPGFTGG